MPARPRFSALLAALLAAPLVAACGSMGSTGVNASGARMFDLASVQPVAHNAGSAGPRNLQLVVYEPTSVRALDGDRVIVHQARSEVSYLEGALWSDRLPVLVQNRLVEALSSSGKFRAVSNGRDKVDPDVSLTSTIQEFQIDLASGQPVSKVTLNIKIVDERSGSVLARRTFTGSAPVASKETSDHVRAINEAFSIATGEVVSWISQLNVKPKKGRMAPAIARGTVLPDGKTSGRDSLVSQNR